MISKRIRCVLALAAVAFLPVLARADEAEDRRVAAVTLLDQLHSADTMTGMMPGIIGQIRTNLTHNDPTLSKQFDEFTPHLLAEAEDQKGALIAKLVDVYATSFTADELHQISDFYRTPVGQKMIATEAQLNSKILVVAREWGTRVAQKMAQDAAVELQGPTH